MQRQCHQCQSFWDIIHQEEASDHHCGIIKNEFDIALHNFHNDERHVEGCFRRSRSSFLTVPSTSSFIPPPTPSSDSDFVFDFSSSVHRFDSMLPNLPTATANNAANNQSTMDNIEQPNSSNISFPIDENNKMIRGDIPVFDDEPQSDISDCPSDCDCMVKLDQINETDEGVKIESSNEDDSETRDVNSGTLDNTHRDAIRQNVNVQRQKRKSQKSRKVLASIYKGDSRFNEFVDDSSDLDFRPNGGSNKKDGERKLKRHKRQRIVLPTRSSGGYRDNRKTTLKPSQPTLVNHKKNLQSSSTTVDDELSTKLERENPHCKTLGLKCLHNKCTAMFPSLDKLYQHHRIVHSRNPFFCLASSKLCKKHFLTRQALVEHLTGNDHKDQTIWNCKSCKGKFICLNMSDLVEHTWREHEEGHFKCDYKEECTFEAKYRVDVFNHIAQSH